MPNVEPTPTPATTLLVVGRISGGFTSAQSRTHNYPSNYPASGVKNFSRVQDEPNNDTSNYPATGGKDLGACRIAYKGKIYYTLFFNTMIRQAPESLPPLAG